MKKNCLKKLIHYFSNAIGFDWAFFFFTELNDIKIRLNKSSILSRTVHRTDK